jgi:phosphoribosylformylglycinamidine synthase
MKAAVLVFPGSNCDRDAVTAIARVSGRDPVRVWHTETTLPKGLDLVVVPGGFSYGDYLRSGAMAAVSPVMSALQAFAAGGGHVLGICNGFQILTEARILPGALLRNTGQRFVCRLQPLTVAENQSAFTRGYASGATLALPIAHHDGNYFADDSTLDRLEGDGLVAFRYRDNPNGSARDIAGVLSPNRRVLGLMPHPERAVGGTETGNDGQLLFEGLLGQVSTAA